MRCGSRCDKPKTSYFLKFLDTIKSPHFSRLKSSFGLQKRISSNDALDDLVFRGNSLTDLHPQAIPVSTTSARE